MRWCGKLGQIFHFTILAFIKPYYGSCKQMLENLNVCDICVFIVNIRFSLVSVAVIIVNSLT